MIEDIKVYLNKYKAIIAGLFLFLMTVAVYRDVINHEFINFDDDIYVTENSRVLRGLDLDNVLWAFRLTDSKNTPYWHPVTWLSHMLDCRLFGLNAGMHHLTNLIFHIANVLLLFYILNLATGATWRSAIVAALFAVHPVNIESVAWIAERKNVLSTFFWMLTILTYVYYTKHPGILRYLAALLLFILGLLSKPMLMTLPFLLLLIDFWPLQRFELIKPGLQKKMLFSILMEKIPFLIVSCCSIYISLFSLKLTGNLMSTWLVPMGLRLKNAIVSYMAYIGKILWPVKLSVYYPFPGDIAGWKVAASLIMLISFTLFVLIRMKRFRYLGTGWFWFAGTLVPVSGIIQGGLWPAMADRWGYVPYIGLFIILSWGGYDILIRYRFKNIMAGLVSVIMLSTLFTATSFQLKYWHDSKSLYKRALEVVPVNSVILNNIGNASAKEGKLLEAAGYYREALALRPYYAKAHDNLGIVLYKLGRVDEAIGHYIESLRISPEYPNAHNNIGGAFAEIGKEKEAVYHYSEALRINPYYDEAHYNLGLLLFKQNRIEEAVAHYVKAIYLNPYYAEAHNNLGLAYYKLGRTGDAFKHYSEALRLAPGLYQAHKNLGTALFNSGNFDGAEEHFKRALAINPENKDTLEKIQAVLGIKAKLHAEEKTLLDKIAGAPNDFAHYGDLGDLYVKYKRLDLAAEQYIKAIVIDPDNHISIIKLAKVYAMKGNFSKALSEAEKAISINPDYAYGYYFIASVYSLMNDKERSLEWLKKAVGKGFNNWDYMRSDKNLYNIRNTSYYMDLAANK